MKKTVKLLNDTGMAVDVMKFLYGKLLLIYQYLWDNAQGEMRSKEDIATATFYSAGSGGFNNALSRLNTIGLIERTPEGIRVSPNLMNL